MTPTFCSPLFHRLAPLDSSFLDQPFSLQEIKEAVWNSGGDKSPGPDGFTFKFIRKHWETVKEDILDYMKEFERSACIPRGCNSSFFTLIPKVNDPLTIGDFRPISLIGCQYKILAKVLANRLAQVISTIVSDVHGKWKPWLKKSKVSPWTNKCWFMVETSLVTAVSLSPLRPEWVNPPSCRYYVDVGQGTEDTDICQYCFHWKDYQTGCW